jgi:2-polyprenyl-3-methyl-5-hydroxy-6-metoxy-1,4-benzoquinol methylase
MAAAKLRILPSCRIYPASFMKQTESLKPDRIMQFAWGYAPTLILETAVRHGIFDLLDKSPQTVKELQQATGSSQRGLTAVLNALVSLEFLTKQNGRYSLTPESATFLVSGKPGYHGMFFQHISDQLLPRWLQLHEVVRTGKPARPINEQAQGAEFFAAFVESLFPLSYAAASALGEHLQVPATKGNLSVLDIGAGSGVWGIALAKQSPHVRIHAVDWDKVLDVTRRIATKHGVADQLTTSAGDFFEADFGKNHQIATVGHILHSEGPERSRRLLRKIFQALAPGGTIAIQEFIANDERTAPPNALIFGVNMLVNTEAGDAFTFAEMSEWLREAGFKNPRLLEVPAVSPLVLADKPK